MAKRMFSSVLLVGRIATLCVGLAVVLALVVGVATSATAADGKPFVLGKGNVATKVTNLVNRGVGPALGLKVGADQAPLTVNAEAGTATNLSADELDGKSSEDFAPAYERTVVVSPAGSATESGAALEAALTGIKDASESKPYLLKLEPGVYDLGADWMAMKEWVDIEGSGEGVTKISGRSYSSQPYDGTIFARNNAELRYLTVENTGGGYSATAIAINTASTRLTHVTVKASGASAFNTGVYISNGSPRIEDSTIRATYALDLEYDGTTYVDGSNITGSVTVDGSHNSNNAPDLRVSGSEVAGTVSTRLGATAKCVASYNANYDSLGAGCV